MFGFTRILRSSIPAYTSSFIKTSISNSSYSSNIPSIQKIDIKSKHL